MKRGVFIYSAITCVITVITAYLLLPFYAPVLLSHLLEEHDVQIHTMEIGYPSLLLQRLNIDTIEFSYQNSERIILKQGLLSYNANNAFSLVFTSAHYTHTNRIDTEASPSQEVTNRSDYLPSELLSKMPQLDIRIATLTNGITDVMPFGSFNAPDSSNVALSDIIFTDITLAIDKNALNAHSQFDTIIDDAKVTHRLELSASANNHVTFTINKLTDDKLADNAKNETAKENPWFRIASTLSLGDGVLQGEIKTFIDVSDVSEFLPEPEITGEAKSKSTLVWTERGVGLSGLTVLTEIDAHIRQQNNVQLNLNLQGRTHIENDVVNVYLFYDDKTKNHIEYVADATPTFDVVFTKSFNVQFDLNEGLFAVKSPLDSQLFFSSTRSNGKQIEKIQLASFVQKDIVIDTAKSSVNFALELLIKGEALSQFVESTTKQNTHSKDTNNSENNAHKSNEKLITADQKDILFDLLISANDSTSTIALTRSHVVDLSIHALRDNGFSLFQLDLPLQEVTVNYASDTLSHFDGSIVGDINMYYEVKKIPLKTHIEVTSSQQDSSEQKINVKLTSEPFAIDDNTLPGFIFTTDFDASQTDTLKAEFSLDNMCQQRLIEGSWQNKGDDSQIDLEANAFFSKNSSSKHWLNMDKWPLDITKGEFNAKMRIDIDAGKTSIEGNAELLNADVIGEFGSFNDVQLRFSAPKSNSHYRHRHLDFKGNIATANVGVEMNNIQIAGRLGNEVTSKQGKAVSYVQLDKSSADIFDGVLSVQPGRINLDDVMSFEVSLDDIDLSKIVETQQIDGLQTTGKMSGMLPVKIQASGAVIDDGKLYNKEGGLIRYSSPLNASADLNEQLKLTLDVLENFNYEILNTNVNFKDGNLIFQSKISGQNPDVAGGQKIDLNLNTEVDMTSTMELLRLQSGLEAEIEQLLNNNLGAQSNINICEQRL